MRNFNCARKTIGTIQQLGQSAQFRRYLAGKSSARGPDQNNPKQGESASKPADMSTSRMTRSQSSKSSCEQHSPNEVKLDKNSKRFTLDLGQNKSARIDYKPIGDNKIEMYHTEVPLELRGRGLGKTLARGALEKAARNNMKVKLTCTYLIDFSKRCADARIKSIITGE